ncbi:acyltransferase [Kocuria rosea]|uniref:acyltransferase family protein n=1 Tax=Kocuria rosea TaxID=1275 RepID=UPI0009E7492D|nr:acyltransferase [Kocuria polaris]
MSHKAIGSQASQRIAWIDAARTFSVLAVVLYHVYIWHFASIDMPMDALSGHIWEGVSRLLGAVRMPLLLIVSGMLASSRIRSTDGLAGVFHYSIANYYLYLIWLAMYALFGFWIFGTGSPNSVDGLYGFLDQVVLPDTSLWFVFALAVYAPLLALFRSISPTIVVGTLFVISVATATFGAEPELMAVKVARLFVFFAVGVYFKNIIITLAEFRAFLLTSIGSALGLMLMFFSSTLSTELLHELAYLVRSMVLALSCIGALSLTVRLSPLSRVGEWVGSRTLGIYVIHPLIVVFWSRLVTDYAWLVPSWFVQSSWLGFFYPLVLGIGVLFLAIGLEKLAKQLGAAFLFRTPNWLHALLKRVSPSRR